MNIDEIIVVRKAVQSDLDVIGELWTEMMRFHQSSLPYPLVSDAATIQRAFMKKRLEQEATLVLVAEVEGQVVGYCRASVEHYPAVYEQYLYGLISELSVREFNRRQGLGEKLYLATREWFEEQGVTRIEVGTATQNPVSNAFWEKMGFATYRETKAQNLNDDMRRSDTD